MKKTFTMTFAWLSAFALPVVAFAQTGSTNTLSDFAKLAVYYFNVAIGLIIGLAMVVFIFNIYRYFMTNKGEGNKDRGTYLLWSIIGFFVIISFWGLVNLIGGTFRLNTAAPTNFMNLYNASGGSSAASSNPLNPSNTVGTVNSSSGSLNPTNTVGADNSAAIQQCIDSGSDASTCASGYDASGNSINNQ